MRLRLLKNWYSITVSTKTNDPTAVSANPTKDFGKTPRSRRNEQSIPPVMKNERPKTQRNLLKRKRYRPEHSQLHQIPNWGRATAPEFSIQYCPKPAAAIIPRRSGSSQGWKGGSPEGGEGGIRKSRRPHSLVRRKATIKSPRTTWYSPLVKPERTPKAKRCYLIKNRRKSANCKSNKPKMPGGNRDKSR